MKVPAQGSNYERCYLTGVEAQLFVVKWLDYAGLGLPPRDQDSGLPPRAPLGRGISRARPFFWDLGGWLGFGFAAEREFEEAGGEGWDCGEGEEYREEGGRADEAGGEVAAGVGVVGARFHRPDFAPPALGDGEACQTEQRCQSIKDGGGRGECWDQAMRERLAAGGRDKASVYAGWLNGAGHLLGYGTGHGTSGLFQPIGHALLGGDIGRQRLGGQAGAGFTFGRRCHGENGVAAGELVEKIGERAALGGVVEAGDLDALP